MNRKDVTSLSDLFRKSSQIDNIKYITNSFPSHQYRIKQQLKTSPISAIGHGQGGGGGRPTTYVHGHEDKIYIYIPNRDANGYVHFI